MGDILSVVQASLATPPPPPTTTDMPESEPESVVQIFVEEEQNWDDDKDDHVVVDDVEQVLDPNDVVFDDMGEGAGVEGDLDMDDD
jgi:hypothetical protein